MPALVNSLAAVRLLRSFSYNPQTSTMYIYSDNLINDSLNK